MLDFLLAQGLNPDGGQGSSFGFFIPLIFMFVIFYFLLIRPQKKKQQEHQNMINNLKKGDKVVTSGGIHGRVTAVDGNTASVEIADNVRVKVVKANVAVVINPSTQAPAKKEQQ